MAPPRFTPVQLWWLAILVSGGKGRTDIAAGVAGAESGGDPAAFNVNTDAQHSVDRGLWQINNYWHREVSDDCAYRALCNARNAYRISNGWTNFTPWSTYNHGLYLEHMPPASGLPVPIPDSLLSRLWKPANLPAGALLTPGSAPFGNPGITGGGTPSGQDYSGKVKRTGERGGYHGSRINDTANAISRLSSGRRLPT